MVADVFVSSDTRLTALTNFFKYRFVIENFFFAENLFWSVAQAFLKIFFYSVAFRPFYSLKYEPVALVFSRRSEITKNSFRVNDVGFAASVRLASTVAVKTFGDSLMLGKVLLSETDSNSDLASRSFFTTK